MLIQFGHNDSKIKLSLNRYTLPGLGDEIENATDTVTKKPVVIHTYGWYMRKYVADTLAEGATPIIFSCVPRCKWDESGKIVRGEENHCLWAKQVARETGVSFVPLNDIIADRYDRLGKDRVKARYFPGDNTHTNLSGDMAERGGCHRRDFATEQLSAGCIRGGSAAQSTATGIGDAAGRPADSVGEIVATRVAFLHAVGTKYDPSLKWIAGQEGRMLRRVIRWSQINSGTTNQAGLRKLCGVLKKDFKALGGRMRTHRLSPMVTIDRRAVEVRTPLGEAISILKRPKAKRRVFLCIHMDTVYGADDPFQKVGKVKDGRLHGPGVADAKGGLAVMLTALEALEAQPPGGKYWVGDSNKPRRRSGIARFNGIVERGGKTKSGGTTL